MPGDRPTAGDGRTTGDERATDGVDDSSRRGDRPADAGGDPGDRGDTAGGFDADTDADAGAGWTVGDWTDPDPGDRPPERLRVMSYNVRYAGVDGGPRAWERRRDAVAGVVRAAAPDVLAVQECWMDQFGDLRERLPGHEWVAAPDRNGEHTPIGVRRDRLAVEAGGGFGLAPGGERNVAGWDGALPRTVTHATLRDRRSGRRLVVLSVHLDHRGERARLEGARLVRERLPERPRAAVVAGDCNCDPGSDPYRVLTGDREGDGGLDDARAVARRRAGPEETFVGFGGAAPGEDGPPRARRIDYAFVRGVDVAAYRVPESDAAPERRPSDHRPVVVDLDLDLAPSPGSGSGG